jgi:hypothetical protein
VSQEHQLTDAPAGHHLLPGDIVYAK